MNHHQVQIFLSKSSSGVFREAGPYLPQGGCDEQKIAFKLLG